jgi:hypothetical protein
MARCSLKIHSFGVIGQIKRTPNGLQIERVLYTTGSHWRNTVLQEGSRFKRYVVALLV